MSGIIGVGPDSTSGIIGAFPAGHVLQCLSDETITQVSTTGTADVGLSIAITPRATSSKIQILVSLMGISATGAAAARSNYFLYQNIAGGSEVLLIDGGANLYLYNSATTGLRHGGFSMQQLDAPSTTSAVTYHVEFSAAAGTSIVQQDDNSGISSITVMEIAG